MANSHIEQIFSSFGQKIGISDLKLDENNGCFLYFDEILVHFHWNQETDLLFFNAVLAPLPNPVHSKLYQLLLEGNHFFQETNQGALGIDQQHQLITISYQTPTQILDDWRFEKQLENFLAATEKWTQKIAEFLDANEMGQIEPDSPLNRLGPQNPPDSILPSFQMFA